MSRTAIVLHSGPYAYDLFLQNLTAAELDNKIIMLKQALARKMQ